jgi:hypothetical protein
MEMKALKVTDLALPDDPAEFHQWDTTMCTLVASRPGGRELVAMLDGALERPDSFGGNTLTAAEFDDPMWDDVGERNREEGLADSSVSTHSASAATHTTSRSTISDVHKPPATKISYASLTEEARRLDVEFYLTIKQVVKGARALLLSRAKHHRWTEAMFLLHKNIEISSTVTKSEAIKGMLALRWDGSASNYELQLSQKVDSILSSKCTMMDFILMCVLKSGLPSAVQYEIAGIINQADGHTDIQLYDIIHQVCSKLASLSVNVPTANVTMPSPGENSKCTRCGRNSSVCGGHLKCYRNKDVNGKELDKSTKTEEAIRLGREFSLVYDQRQKNEKKSNVNSAEQKSETNTEIKNELEHAMLEYLRSQTSNKGNIEPYLLYLFHEFIRISRASSSFQANFSVVGKEILAILDSGAGIHLSPHACDVDVMCQITVSGFNNSTGVTNGMGVIPCVFEDCESREKFNYALEEVHQFDGDKTLISLGMLLRNGFDIVSSGHDDISLLTPDGQHRVKVHLGDDNILYIRFAVTRDRADVFQFGKRKMAQATYGVLHGVFNHCGKNKLELTLKFTDGVSLGRGEKECFCKSCATCKSRRKGLRRKPVSKDVGPAFNAGDAVFLDQDVFSGSAFNAEDVGFFDQDDFLLDLGPHQEPIFEAPVPGEVLPVLDQHPFLTPTDLHRYDVAKLRPFEVMYVDNKNYPCEVRGGKMVAFVLVDLKTFAIFKVDVTAKSHNGWALRKVVAQEGVHKLPYKCTVYADNCGSMEHVAQTCVSMGLNFQPLPPKDQSLNLAEKAIDIVFHAATTHLVESGRSSKYYPQAVDFACYSHLRMATTESRGFVTPYEAIKGVRPDVGHMRLFGTIGYVVVDKGERAKHSGTKELRQPAVRGIFLGYHAIWGNTYKVMTNERLGTVVHSRHVVFDIDKADYAPLEEAILPDLGQFEVEQPLSLPSSVGLEEASFEPPPTSESQQEENEIYEPLSPEESQEEDESASEQEEQPPSSRYPTRNRIQPADIYQEALDKEEEHKRARNTLLARIDLSADLAEKEHAELKSYLAHVNHCYALAYNVTKDIPWPKLLKMHPTEAIEALDKEIASLEKNILVKLTSEHPEYDVAVKEATPGRFIGDIRRKGMVKARGVKQGFREDIARTDGPDFNYYSHVAKLNTVRSVLMRRNRRERRLAIKDVRTAFLQSNKYPPDAPKKYMRFKHPLTGEIMIYRQLAPIYGENSAPKHWEDTLFEWLCTSEEEGGAGLTRGENEPCVLYNEERDLVVLVYVDDILADGAEEDVKWFLDSLGERFECKEDEWLDKDNPLDFLGLEISMDEENVYLSLGAYIDKMLVAMNMQDCKPVMTPMDREITDFTPLPKKLEKPFRTGVGCLGWCVNTVRLDASLAYSRIAQHLANPCKGAWDALLHLMKYFRGTGGASIHQPLFEDDEHGWKFFTDSDFASNAWEENRRRSQNGFLAMCGSAPVMWSSKVSSVGFAHPDIGEAHADMSSGAAEVYAAANATMDMLHLSNTMDEAGNIPFPKPMVLEMDNTTAECFANNTAFKSKLKHIDVRQHWVRTLRDKRLILPKHVSTVDNLADLFTKVLSRERFRELVSRILIFR